MNAVSSVFLIAPRLIEALRQELQEYGEMLALLDHQQASVIARAADEVMRSVEAVNEAMQKIRTARQHRESLQNEVALLLKTPPHPPLTTLISSLPVKFRLPVQTLLRENNQLLTRVQQRARQNHLLLSRSLHLMQEFLDDLTLRASPTTYNEGGNTESVVQSRLYDAVG